MKVDNIMEEKWLAVVGYESTYEVSSLGRIRNAKTGRLLKASPNVFGYPRVSLHLGGQRSVLVHRAVAEAFIANPASLPFVNHKNGVRDDARVENLEWTDATGNNRHAAHVLGRRHQVLNPDAAEFIREIGDAYPTRRLARVFGCCPKTIRNTLLGQRWVGCKMESST